jgi:putative membrane protein
LVIMSVLTAEETARVEATIGEVESKTAAEIVVATLRATERYHDVRLWSVLAASITAATVAHWFWPLLGVAEVLYVQIAAGVLAWLLSGIPAVLRVLTPKHRQREAVERAAELAFLEHGVFATKERTGVLILFSELEHRVAILGDEGIHGRLHTEGWNQLVAHMVQRIHEHRAGDGLCEVVTRLGEHLAEHFPAAQVNPNELDNRVRTGGEPPRG